MSFRRLVLLALIVVAIGFIHRKRRDRREEAKTPEGDADFAPAMTSAT